MELIGLEPVKEIIHTTILSGQVDESIPLSILLVGPSGGGKSKSVVRFAGEMLHLTDDLTTQGLFSILQQDRDSKKTHIILGDLNPVLSHKSSVTKLTMASILSLTSEGTVRIDDGRTEKALPHKPMGFIAAVTPEMYMEQAERWRKLGVLRRICPICYNYTTATKQRINRAIRRGSVNFKLQPIVMIKPLKKKAKIIIDEQLRMVIEALSIRLATNLGHRTIWPRFDGGQGRGERKLVPGNPVLEFSPHLFLRTMAQAHAIYRGKGKVEQADLDFLADLIDFTNPILPKLI